MSKLTSLDAEVEDIESPSGLTKTERSTIKDRRRLRAAVIYEIIRQEGEAELARKFHALWWSGVAAGLSIGFSFLSEAWLAATLPDAPWKPIIENLGYTVGFLIVILGRQQLFTENTLTAVLPVIARRQWGWVFTLARLWATVLAANLVGCFLFALFIVKTSAVSADVDASLTEVARHLMDNDMAQMFVKGIVAGWLIAALVWILPSVEGSEFPIIVVITFLIAHGDLTHVIAGSAEAFFLVFKGLITWQSSFVDFFLPTLAGNVVGGTVLFSVLSYVQVREEISENSPT